MPHYIGQGRYALPEAFANLLYRRPTERLLKNNDLTRAGETALTHLSSQTVRTKTYLPAAKAKQECPQKKIKKKKNCGPSQSPKRSRAVLGSVEASMQNGKIPGFLACHDCEETHLVSAAQRSATLAASPSLDMWKGSYVCGIKKE